MNSVFLEVNIIVILTPRLSKKFDTSEVIDMQDFFLNSNINADLFSWDVVVITIMNTMLHTASTFNIDISKCDIVVVTHTNVIFYQACFSITIFLALM